MTCIVQYDTKAAFKKAVAEDPKRVSIYAPALHGERTFTADTIPVGTTEYVTNHPKRSWFAAIKNTAKGLKVS
jgi:hypothetical protein